ncbi:putative oxidoreductase [Porphyridium purpureum]|uniref:Putative oxidoreductase n=1 Tax=Porphyridium purpureum TaxID=35688 RepID=A0A5J4Z929_PORPP|nr:putative oxidoreductase [Porphyridium purpureum]|eukprot:POR0103..scf295_1
MVEKVLLTGASGYIALEILYQLHEQGQYQVRGTVRDVANEEKCRPIREVYPNPKYPVELVKADLTSDEGWAEAVTGVSYILHTASPVIMNVQNEDDLMIPAREGTLRVLRAAAKEPSVKRVIFTSSLVAVGWHSHNSNEYVNGPDDWSDVFPDPYYKSKTLAEKAAWDFVKENKENQFELCTINPALVVGRFRGSVSASLKLVGNIATGKLSFLPPVGTPLVDVEDVGAAHVSAITNGVPGQRYLVVDGSAWVADIAEVCRAELGSLGYTKIPSHKPPYFLVKLLSFFAADAASAVRSWNTNPLFDNSVTKQHLGVQFHDWREALVSALHCMIADGEIPATEAYKAKYPEAIKA